MEMIEKATDLTQALTKITSEKRNVNDLVEKRKNFLL